MADLSTKIAQLQVDPTSATPLYIQLISRLKSALLGEEWLAGEAIPSERELAQLLAISRGTARKAIQALIAEGLIIQIQGSGTFVAPKLAQSLTNLQSFSANAEQQHYPSHNQLISLNQRPATPEEVIALQLKSQRKITELRRIQSIGNVVVSLQKALLALDCSESALISQHSLYHYLDSIGYSITHATQSFHGAVADSELANYLNIDIGTPLLLVIRKGFIANNTPIEYTYSWHINDYCDFTIELTTDFRKQRDKEQ